MKYKLLDSGHRQKLEQIGKYRLVRPAMNAFWAPKLSKAEWDRADGIFTRNSSGGGNWQWNKKLPPSWQVEWGGFELKIKPTDFGHIGFFAEQHHNWQWLQSTIASMPQPVKTINLFAYSGVASMAMAAAGANVCHVDAARGMNDWGKENMLLNPTIPQKIRWIADDAVKFIEREIRRKNSYNGIVLDPPSFGRGAKGQIWKIEESINRLLNLCSKLIEPGKPFFVLLSGHTPGFSPIVLERLLEQHFGKGIIESGEMTIPDNNEGLLPAGNFARMNKGN
jgi:23S rRNA (cytosine1962-C5)-methyltransferase